MRRFLFITTRAVLGVLVGLLIGTAGLAWAGGTGLGSSFSVGGSGLSTATANLSYLRLDGTNTMTGALTSSNGGFTATGATTALTLTGGFTPTGAASEIGTKFVMVGDFASNDIPYRFYDNNGAGVLFSLTGDGAGVFTNYVQAASANLGSIADLSPATRITLTASGSSTYNSPDAADGSMVAHKFTTTNTAATTDKLLSIQNVTTEKLYVGPDGSVFPGASLGANLGSATVRWLGVYASTFNGTNVIANNYTDTAGAARITLTTTGASTFTSTLAATGGVDVGNIISVGAADYAAADKVLSLQDNSGTELAYFTGDGTTVSTAGYFSGYVRSGNYTDGGGVSRFTPTTSGKSAYVATTTLTGGEDLGHTFYVTTDFLTADKVLQWGDNTTTELGAVFGDGAMQLDGDLTVDGGDILNAGTAAGVNLTIASAANSAGEYGVTVGTNSTSTAETIFSAATDIDGTPVHKFTVLGTGNVGLGGDASDLYAVSIVGQTIIQATPRGFNMPLNLVLESNTAAGGTVIGMVLDATIDPGDTETMIGLDVEMQITADVGETHGTATMVNIRHPAKTGTGTITTGYGMLINGTADYAATTYGAYIGQVQATTSGYGLYVEAPSAASTTNIAISTAGLIQFEREVGATIAAPFTCALAYVGSQLYVDDTNDGVAGFMCMCAKNADDTTYQWSKVNSPGTVCF